MKSRRSGSGKPEDQTGLLSTPFNASVATSVDDTRGELTVHRKKTPSPRREGTTNIQAKTLMQRIRCELADDAEALLVVRDLVRLLAARSRVSRRAG
jgi:hypothetical protein